jgi:DNA-binding response OmpR family regulator
MAATEQCDANSFKPKTSPNPGLVQSIRLFKYGTVACFFTIPRKCKKYCSIPNSLSVSTYFPMSSEPTPLVVIIEDEQELAHLMSRFIENAGMRTQICHRAQQAIQYLSAHHANLLLLDVRLPDQSGFELMKELRSKNIQVPVIFVTANSIEESRIRGLNMGGEDYITKPFSYLELVARIRVVLRRGAKGGDLSLTPNVSVADQPFEFCGAQVNPHRLEFSLPGLPPRKIGRKEIGIMAHLIQNIGEVIPRKALIHAVWGMHANVQSRSIDQYIVKVRNLCRSSKAGLDAVRTVHGVGYIFDPDGKQHSTV